MCVSTLDIIHAGDIWTNMQGQSLDKVATAKQDTSIYVDLDS